MGDGGTGIRVGREGSSERLAYERQMRGSDSRIRLIEVMAMIAGLALGFWLVIDDLRPASVASMSFSDSGLLLIVSILGGLSLVGPVLLLGERRRGWPWGPGRLLWFSTGMAAWLLWPPVVYARFSGRRMGDTISGPCFAYGTPLMALYVTLALLAGGWLRTARRRRMRRSARERFGLLVGMLWACTGFYVLHLLYSSDVFGRR